MTKLLQEIQTYWTNRAEGYSQVNQGELHSEQKYKWQQTLLQYIPFKANKNIKILDIGTGPGFFAIILAQLGFDITAIDYTEQMLLEAKQNAGKLSEQIDFQQMDAQNLNFPDKKFDVIVTRNLTWNLENPQQAYSEWYRVLKKDGVLLNFDANWYNHLFDEQKRQAYEEDRKIVAKAHIDDHYTCTDIDAMENIARQVPLSGINRPDWDREILTKIGFTTINIIPDIWQQVWSDEENFATPSHTDEIFPDTPCEESEHPALPPVSRSYSGVWGRSVTHYSPVRHSQIMLLHQCF